MPAQARRFVYVAGQTAALRTAVATAGSSARAAHRCAPGCRFSTAFTFRLRSLVGARPPHAGNLGPAVELREGDGAVVHNLVSGFASSFQGEHSEAAPERHFGADLAAHFLTQISGQISGQISLDATRGRLFATPPALRFPSHQPYPPERHGVVRVLVMKVVVIILARWRGLILGHPATRA